MITLFRIGKKGQKDVKVFSQNDVREEIVRRAIVNTEARKEAILAATKPQIKPVQKSAPATVNPHAATIQKLDEILTKVSGFENSKIAAIAELALALETGDFKNLITLLKKKDTAAPVRKKKATWEL
jgi:hypothetical protein